MSGVDLIHDGSVSKWHPWLDKPGMRYKPAYWRDSIIHTHEETEPCPINSIDELIAEVKSDQLFCFVGELFNPESFPYGNALLGQSDIMPYVGRSGLAALRVKGRKRNGYIVPGASWLWRNLPDSQLLQFYTRLCALFGYQSTTLPSLSEKILRASLPNSMVISRPSGMLRRDILENNPGGRIDQVDAPGKFYERVVEYDANKKYLYHSCVTVSPYVSPNILVLPQLGEIREYAVSFCLCRLWVHYSGTSPLLINGKGPKQGIAIERWLWDGELQDCLDAGFTLDQIVRGYGWHELSNFMMQWAETLWQRYEQAENLDPWFRECIKRMMVGLPGRFLRQPETYQLVHISEEKLGDIPLKTGILKDGVPVFTDWLVRPIYDRESTALSPVGSYIVSEARRDLYHEMKKAEKHGHTVIRSYVDCFSIDAHHATGDNLYSPTIGQTPGTWKAKTYTDVWASENRFIAKKPGGRLDIVAPGYDRNAKAKLVKEYRKIVEEHAQDI